MPVVGVALLRYLSNVFNLVLQSIAGRLSLGLRVGIDALGGINFHFIR
jgi:hypothetical protein